MERTDQFPGSIYLLGGVGAGKSTVLNELAKTYGARIIPTDLVARRLMEKGAPVYQRVLDAFGTAYLAPDGEIDRPAMAARVFADPEARKKLDSLVHPAVWQYVHGELEIARSNPDSLTVVEAAVYAPAEREWFDQIWAVRADREVRIRRLMADRGYSRQRCLDMMGSQESEKTYLQAADVVIDNSGEREETAAQIRAVMQAMKRE